MQDFIVKHFILFFFIFLVQFAFSQSNDIREDMAYLHGIPSLQPIADCLSNEIMIMGEGRQNSNALPIAILTDVLGGGFLSNNIKNRVKNFPSSRRLYEHELAAGIHYKHRFKKNDLTLHVGYKFRNMLYANISRDALNLLVYGNKMYEDQYADLSNMRFENLQYNQFSLGISKKEQRLYAGLMLSFLVGDNNQQLRSRDGSFYTAPYGEYIDIAYNFRFNQSHEGAPVFMQPKGYGFSADLQLAYEFEKGTLLFNVTDLGLIAWGGQSFNYSNDTSFRFEGIYVIDNLIRINDYKFQFSSDSLITNLVSSKTNFRYNTTLPSTFLLTYSFFQNIGKTKVQINCGVQTRLLTNYYAMAFAKANFFLPKHFVTSLSLSGGGYSLFNVGWDVGYFGKHFQAQIGTHNLIGMIAPRHYPSTSVSLRTSFRF
jgi:hypothetical protein